MWKQNIVSLTLFACACLTKHNKYTVYVWQIKKKICYSTQSLKKSLSFYKTHPMIHWGYTVLKPVTASVLLQYVTKITKWTKLYIYK